MPSRGRIVLDGERLDERPPEERPIGVVFQDYLLFPHLSVLDNVAFGLRAAGAPRKAARRRAAEWLDRAGLADRAAARPRELSGGQQQRVALARALVTQPRLLLLDEPLAALDVTARRATRRALADDLSHFGGSRILVTHDPVDAMALAEQLAVIEAGRVVQVGPPDEITSRPRTAYVADLVGVNLFRGPLAHELVAAEPIAGDVLAVVHPRAVAIHRRPPEGTPRNVWPGTVTGVDREGDRARVQVAGRVPIVAEVTAAAVADLDLRPGADVWVSVKATEVTVYPA